MTLPNIDLAAFEEVWLGWVIDPAEEKLLWAGRPTRLYKYDGTPAVLLAALLWIPIAWTLCAMDTMPLGWDAPWEQIYLRMLSIAFTAFLIIFPLWKRFKARHTVCVLTDKRAIIQSPRLLGRPRHQIYPLHADMIRDSYANKQGVGSIVFDYGLTFIGGNHFASWPIGFINIPDAEQVLQLLYHEIFHRHGLTPPCAAAQPAGHTGSAALRQLVVGILLLMAGAATGLSTTSLPRGWVQHSVILTYAHAHRTAGENASFLLQAADGTCFRVPVAGTRGRHREGERIDIAYPAHNPLQARVATTHTSGYLMATMLGGIGAFLILQALMFYHTKKP